MLVIAKSVYNFKPLYGIKSCKLKVYHWQNKTGSLTLRLTFVKPYWSCSLNTDMHEKLYIGNQFGKFQMDA